MSAMSQHETSLGSLPFTSTAPTNIFVKGVTNYKISYLSPCYILLYFPFLCFIFMINVMIVL